MTAQASPDRAHPAARAYLSETDHARARALFDRLREISFDGVGISRESYGPLETQAMEMIEAEGRALGAEIRWDAARNLRVALPGRMPALPVVAAGSHLDSVPQGGNFDGAAGVLAALLALRAAHARGETLRTIELHVLRAEESAWFGGPCYFGSRALFGQITGRDLESRHRSADRNLAEQMAAAGVDLAPLRAGTPLDDPARFHAWIELHIEQGPVLIDRDCPMGVVTGIRGNVRHRRVSVTGEAAHSGAVPRWLRRDAVLAMAELLMRLDEHWRVLLEWGEDLVVTSGIVETDPAEHAVSRVPGRVAFALEYRSQDPKTLEAFGRLIARECGEIGARRGVAFELGEGVPTAPARMSERLVAGLLAAAEAAQVPAHVMASGAGHDSAVFANAGVPSAMVFVRNRNGSHNPHEAMEYADFARAAEAMARALWAAAQDPAEAPE
ncbi:MAG: hydantoinase/carbamoylase family amidase [Paracoccaceae bacterium]